MHIAQYSCGVLSIESHASLPLAGYGRRSIKVPSVAAGLEANWISFGPRDALRLIIAVDALFSSDTLETGIRKQLASLGLGVAGCMIVASHTHYAPSLDLFKPRLGNADPDHIGEICKRIARDILNKYDAERRWSPVSWSWGLARNRRSVYRRATKLQLSIRSWPPLRVATQIAPNPRVEIDQAMRLWIARNSDDAPIFAVATWPCHATSRADGSVSSADFIAPLRQAIRDRLGRTLPVVFFPGASGDIRPAFWQGRSLKQWLYPYPFQRTFTLPSPRTEAEFDESIRATVDAILTARMTRLAFTDSVLSYSEFPLSDFMTDANDQTVPLYRAVLGGVEITGVGAELSMGWTAELDYVQKPEKNILSGCVGRVFGYLPTEEQIPKRGYEVDGFRKAFDITGQYQPEIAIGLKLRRLIQRL